MEEGINNPQKEFSYVSNVKRMQITLIISLTVSLLATIFILIFPIAWYPSNWYLDIIVNIGLWGDNIGFTKLFTGLLLGAFILSVICSSLLLTQYYGKLAMRLTSSLIVVLVNIITAVLAGVFIGLLTAYIPILSTSPEGIWHYYVGFYSSLIGASTLFILSCLAFKYSNFTIIFPETKKNN
ncbi:MAG: hypothetical protein FK734_05065 [Asgard group archaeon]|nr:hypothetical protein [Asgard group archaeon]